jgi:hypothetical protein
MCLLACLHLFAGTLHSLLASTILPQRKLILRARVAAAIHQSLMRWAFRTEYFGVNGFHQKQSRQLHAPTHVLTTTTLPTLWDASGTRWASWAETCLFSKQFAFSRFLLDFLYTLNSIDTRSTHVACPFLDFAILTLVLLGCCVIQTTQ